METGMLENGFTRRYSNVSESSVSSLSTITEVANERQTLTKPKYNNKESHQSGGSGSEDAPRVIKKRSRSVKSERRSKSLEYRKSKRVSLHTSIPKSKDDLDFGIFTIIERPANPWDKENRLKKGKSCSDIQQPNVLYNQRDLSLSTPNLATEPTTGVDTEESQYNHPEDKAKFPKHIVYIHAGGPPDSADHPQISGAFPNDTILNYNPTPGLQKHYLEPVSNRKILERNIEPQQEDPCEKPPPSPDVNHVFEELKSGVQHKTPFEARQTVKEEVVILHNKQPLVDLNDLRTELNKNNTVNSTLSRLDIVQLKRYFKECVVTVKSTVSEETGEEQSRWVLETQAKDLLQAEELKKNFESLLDSIECVTEDLKTAEKTSFNSTSSSSSEFTRSQRSKKRRIITLKTGFSENTENNIFEQGIEIIKDFLQQLLLESNIEREVATIKKFSVNKRTETRSSKIIVSDEMNEQSSVVTKIDEENKRGEEELHMIPEDNANGGIERTVLSKVVSTLPKESNTFNFIYTIDAELSYVEYTKLMKIINTLQQQKTRWEMDMRNTKEQLKNQNKEKVQLSDNNNILRESLEAANKAIREINGKVHELKETLVPLREENTTLKKENENLLENAEFAKQEYKILVKELDEVNKLKLSSEEMMRQKDHETEEYKTSMQEKLTNLEILYRDYKKDMEKKITANSKELENLRAVNYELSQQNEKLKKENIGFKTEVESQQRKNIQLEDELRKRKSLNMQLDHTSKEKDKLTENTQEIENFYRKEINEVNTEITKFTLEIETYKQDKRFLQSENEKLKFDMENLKSKMNDLENKKENIDSEKEAEKQKLEFLQDEVDNLQKELGQVDGIKNENLNFDNERKKYLNQIDTLQDKVREFESIKRERFVQKHEHQRTKAELDRLRNDLKDLENLKREHTSEKFEKERLLSELQHLQKQVSLLEDQQRILQNPNSSSELKEELGKIRNEMKDLASQNQSRSVELYTNELKGELTSLKNQIKELDVNNRNHELTHTQESIQREATTTLLIQKEGNSSNSYQREFEEPWPHQPASQGDCTNMPQVQVDNTSIVDATRASESGSSSVSSSITEDQNFKSRLRDKHNENVAPIRRKSSGEINKIYVSKSTEISRNEKIRAVSVERQDGEKSDEARLKQIEDRIRRKREKSTDWSMRTPSIDRMRRQSTEELTSTGISESETDSSKISRRRRRAERSPSIGRSKSSDRWNNGKDAYDHPVEGRRGRSLQRRNRRTHSGDFESYQNGKSWTQEAEWNTKGSPRQEYAVEITVDNSRNINSQRKTDGIRNNKELHHSQRENRFQQNDDFPIISPTRRAKSEERRRSRKKVGGDSASSSDNEYHEETTKRKTRERHHSLSSIPFRNIGTPDLLEAAMRERQHQAIISKKGQNTPGILYKPQFSKSEHNISTAFGIRQKMRGDGYPDQNNHLTIDNPLIRRSGSDVGDSGNSQRVEFRSQNHLNRASTLDKNFLSSHDLDGRHNYENYNNNRKDVPQSRGVVLRNQNQLNRRKNLDKGYRSSYHFDEREAMDIRELVGGSLSDKELKPEFRSQGNLNRRQTLDKNFDSKEHRSMSLQKEELIQSIKAEQELKLTLNPAVRKTRHSDVSQGNHNGNNSNGSHDRKQHQYIMSEGRYSSVNQLMLMKKQRETDNNNVSSRHQSSSLKDRKSMNNEEVKQMEKMEQARQNMLKKIQQQDEGKSSKRSVKSQKPGNEVVTVDGVPVARSNRLYASETEEEENHFITEDEAELLFKNQQNGENFDQEQKKKNRHHDGRRHTYTSSRSTTDQQQQQNQQQIHQKKSQQLQHQQQFRQPQHPQQQYQQQQRQKVRTNTWSHSSSKPHGELLGKNEYTLKPFDQYYGHGSSTRESGKRQQQQYDDKRANLQRSYQHTEGTASYTSKTDHTNDIRQHEMVVGNVGRNGRPYTDVSSSHRAKSPTINNYHDHRYCEKCRQLNRNKTAFEPTRYCWEKYYPISETTPRSSAQSFY